MLRQAEARAPPLIGRGITIVVEAPGEQRREQRLAFREPRRLNGLSQRLRLRGG